MSVEEQTVVSEQGTETQETVETTEETTPEINADSSVEDIIASRPEADEDEGSTPSETEQSDTSGEDVKTQEEAVDTSKKSDDEVEAGKPIPYDRFKEVNEAKKTLTTENEQMKADLDEAQSALQDPEVVELILKKRGYDDNAISKYFEEKGVARKTSGVEETPEFDTNTVEGWDAKIEHMMNKKIEARLGPVEQKLTQAEHTQKEKEVEVWLDTQQKDATTLAKDKYGIEFGKTGQDENNPTTAVGKMWSYLEKNPEDKKLGYVKILKLAMAEDSVKKGEEQGVQKEKDRQKKLKAAAMESNTTVTTDETPQADWDVDRIIAWREKHGEQ